MFDACKNLKNKIKFSYLMVFQWGQNFCKNNHLNLQRIRVVRRRTESFLSSHLHFNKTQIGIFVELQPRKPDIVNLTGMLFLIKILWTMKTSPALTLHSSSVCRCCLSWFYSKFIYDALRTYIPSGIGDFIDNKFERLKNIIGRFHFSNMNVKLTQNVKSFRFPHRWYFIKNILSCMVFVQQS